MTGYRGMAEIADAMGILPPDDYAYQRVHDPDMRVRDVGRAIGEVLFTVYGADRVARLTLDSEIVRETLANHVLAELEAAGYRVEFHRLAGTHQ